MCWVFLLISLCLFSIFDSEEKEAWPGPLLASLPETNLLPGRGDHLRHLPSSSFLLGLSPSLTASPETFWGGASGAWRKQKLEGGFGEESHYLGGRAGKELGMALPGSHGPGSGWGWGVHCCCCWPRPVSSSGTACTSCLALFAHTEKTWGKGEALHLGLKLGLLTRGMAPHCLSLRQGQEGRRTTGSGRG